MKTPYDSAVRIREREAGEVRLAISDQNSRLTEVEASRRTIDCALARETELAAADPMLSTFGYLSRMQAERARLDEHRRAIQQRLDRLRDEAAATYGSLHAIQTAAAGYREEQYRAAASAEQAGIDDLSSAAFIRARNRRAKGAGPA